jgi:hypothetical protein
MNGTTSLTMVKNDWKMSAAAGQQCQGAMKMWPKFAQL